MNERSNTPSRCAGVVAAACTQGKRTQHGKPRGVVGDDQPDAREGQAGIPIAKAAAPPPTTARGFVPWRLSDAGQRVRGSVDYRRHPKPCTEPDIAM